MGILFDNLKKYSQSDFYPYHMPGHKRQMKEGVPEEAVALDITEIEDFDNLHQASGILLEAQKRAAEAYGAEESFFLINGSTCGILAAVSAAVPFGGHLLMARNCHKSVYHAAYLRRLNLSYLYPDPVEGADYCEAVTPFQVEEGLEKNPGVQAVLIVSPTYEGRIADVQRIAEVVHRRGIALIVDEAHGAHLGFSEYFAQNSVRAGADLVINSVHKTLPAMTQTALLHCRGNRIHREVLKRFLHIYQSSSPSYVLMASIDHGVQMAREGTEKFRQFYIRWKEMLKRLEKLEKLRILPGIQEKECEYPRQDVGKLVISTAEAGITGSALADILRCRYHLETEMACRSYVLAMFTLADTEEGYERLTEALLELDGELAKEWRNCCPGLPHEESDKQKGDPVSQDERYDCCAAAQRNQRNLQTVTGIPFWQAWEKQKIWIALEEALGKPAGDFINLYPPGIPMAVPGEVITRELLAQIKECLESGLEVQGILQSSGEIQEKKTYIVQVICEEGAEHDQ